MTQVSRRRFLTLAAAATAFPAQAAPTRWRGFALGAEVLLTLYAPRPQAERALDDIRNLLSRVEKLFSLYDPYSALSVLNKRGHLNRPDPTFCALMEHCDILHHATNAIFDPAVQPTWHALAQGKPNPVHIGWHNLHRSDARINLADGQALTFNGIAQGFATDLARNALSAQGLDHALINIGEFSALGGPFQLGIADPDLSMVAVKTLQNRARATSSPAAMALPNGQSHILHPSGVKQPLWSTVSVEADSAAIADGASTAFCMMSKAEIMYSLRQLPGTPTAILVSSKGDLHEVG